MTTKEKAEDLCKMMYAAHSNIYPSTAKKCALIAVDEIIKNFEGLHKPEYCAFDAIGERKFTMEGEYPEHMTGYDMLAYWKDVKVQIEAI